MTRRAPIFCLLSFLVACGERETVEFGEAHKLPKDQRPTVWDASTRDRLGLPDMRGSGGSTGATDESVAQVTGATPEGWVELPADPARFRNAAWRVADAPDTECYLTLGVRGGVAGNLARWYRNQFGIADVPAAEALPSIDFAGRPGRLAELQGTFAGKAEQAALIAFFNEGDSVTSLKFTGPGATVGENRDKFLALAASIRLTKGGAASSAPPIRPGQPMPEGHPQTGAAPAPGTPAPGPMPPSHAATGQPAASPFTAEVPPGWEPVAGSSRTLHHRFGSASEVYLSQLGGTLKASLDIWRGELGLGPMSDSEFAGLPHTLFLGDDGVLLDLRGTFRSMSGRQIDDARLLIAARLDGATITFCKLVGPAAEVDAQRDAFQQFCGSLRRAP